MGYRTINVEGEDYRWKVGESFLDIRSAENRSWRPKVDELRLPDGTIGPRQVANWIRVSLLFLEPLPDQPKPYAPVDLVGPETPPETAVDAKIAALRAMMARHVTVGDRIHLLTATRPDRNTIDGTVHFVIGYFRDPQPAIDIRNFLDGLSKEEAKSVMEELIDRRANRLPSRERHHERDAEQLANERRWKFHIDEMREGIAAIADDPYQLSKDWLRPIVNRLAGRQPGAA